jgi:hypothetical protein
MQTLTPRSAFLSLSLIGVALPWFGRAGHAESTSRDAEITQVSYMYSVAEYCGLNTFEVYDGYQRQMRQLTYQVRLPESTVRSLRVDGIVAADLEFGNRGLGGFRNWCRTEGLDAARHFRAYRDAQLAAERDRETVR